MMSTPIEEAALPSIEEIMADASKSQDAETTKQATSRKRSSEASSSAEGAKRDRIPLEELVIDMLDTGGLSVVDNVEGEKMPKSSDEAIQLESAIEMSMHVVENLETKTSNSPLIDFQAKACGDAEENMKMICGEDVESKSASESSNNSDSESVSDSEDGSIQHANSTEEKSSDNMSESELPEENTRVNNLNLNSNNSIPTEGHLYRKPLQGMASSISPSNQESKISNQVCQGPLSLIGEAMRSFDLAFPKLEQSNANKTAKTAEIEQPEKTEQQQSNNLVSFQKTKSTEVRKMKTKLNMTFAEQNDDSSSSSSANECPSTSIAEKHKNAEESDLQVIKEEKGNALPTDDNFSAASGKDSDSDDSNWRRKTKTIMTEVNSGRDFYEDDSNCEEDRINSREYDKMNADFSPTSVLNDYEQLFHEIRKLVDKVPNRFKYEVYSLQYPTLVMAYLRMIASGKFRRGKAFVDSSLRYIDDSYMARVDKLIALQSASDLPKKAKKLLANENDDQIVVSMCEETYELLLILISTWSRSLQLIFLRHFDLISNNNGGKPNQHHRIGCATLEKIYWATSDTIKEKKETSPRPMRRKRLKKSKTSPTRNIHMPAGNRLYTPMPKRWDLEKQKDDEDHRVPLNRENLPSAYVYTAIELTETVICGTFSSNTTMLAIGTTSAAVHVFSLTSSKLVQLKPANCLKKLDTSMSGIDESMLDASNKKMIRKLYGHQGPIYGCSFAPHDRFLLSSSQDRTVRCWCLLTWNCVVIYPGHSSAVYCVNYAPSGYYFATGSDDRTARIWTQDNKKSICILVGHLAEVVCCKFHPNRHYLATGSADCTVRLWDIIKALQVRVFSGHRGTINAMSYSICGRYLVTGADDRYIIVWDIEKEELVRSLLYHTSSINCIEFPLDNKIFVVGGQDCQMTIWDFDRLVQEIESHEDNQTLNSNTKRSKLSTDDLLIKAYPSKGTPFYKLHITPRNLLLGFCVQLEKSTLKKPKETVHMLASYEKWLEFLDILKIKACFAQKKDELQNCGASNQEAIEVPEEDNPEIFDEYEQEKGEYEEEDESQVNVDEVASSPDETSEGEDEEGNEDDNEDEDEDEQDDESQQSDSSKEAESSDDNEDDGVDDGEDEDDKDEVVQADDEQPKTIEQQSDESEESESSNEDESLVYDNDANEVDAVDDVNVVDDVNEVDEVDAVDDDDDDEVNDVNDADAVDENEVNDVAEVDDVDDVHNEVVELQSEYRSIAFDDKNATPEAIDQHLQAENESETNDCANVSV